MLIVQQISICYGASKGVCPACPIRHFRKPLTTQPANCIVWHHLRCVWKSPHVLQLLHKTYSLGAVTAEAASSSPHRHPETSRCRRRRAYRTADSGGSGSECGRFGWGHVGETKLTPEKRVIEFIVLC